MRCNVLQLSQVGILLSSTELRNSYSASAIFQLQFLYISAAVDKI